MRFIGKICAMVAVAALPAACGHTLSHDRVAAPQSGSPSLSAYCRSIDYADTAMIHNEDSLSAHVAVIARLMQRCDSAEAERALTLFFSSIKHDPEALSIAIRLGDRFLNDPASTLRDDAAYIRWLETLLAVDSLPDYLRVIAEDRRLSALRNCPGSEAADFQFEERVSGEVRSLSDLSAERILLLFYDPDCLHCGEVLDSIACDTAVADRLAADRLVVIAIDAESDKKLWERTCRDLPDKWVVGYDLSGVIESELYDLQDLPSIYLLDKSRRVIHRNPALHDLLISLRSF